MCSKIGSKCQFNINFQEIFCSELVTRTAKDLNDRLKKLEGRVQSAISTPFPIPYPWLLRTYPYH